MSTLKEYSRKFLMQETDDQLSEDRLSTQYSSQTSLKHT